MPYIPTQIRHLISPVHSLCQPQPWHLQFAQRLECWRHIPRRTVSQALGICRHQTTLETRRQIHQTHHDVGATSLLQTDGLRRRGTTVRIPQISAGHSASYSSGPLYCFEEPQTPFKVLILGGSYAGLAAAVNLVDFCHGRKNRFSIDDADKGTGKFIPVQVTIVDPRDGFYHLIGQPLALSSQKFAEAFWTKYTDLAALQTPEIRTVQGSIETVDCASKTATITTSKGPIHESYDYLITATGLQREYPSSPRSLTREKYLAEAAETLANVQAASKGVVVIGGGAVGIEIAAELNMLHPQIPITLIHSRARLLSSETLPDEFAAKALEILQSNKITTILGTRVTDISEPQPSAADGSPEYTLTLSTGSTLVASHVINAVSRFTPTAPSFLPASICDEQGYIRIQPTLEFPADGSVPNSGDHYAAGDVARWSGIKRAGAAMHQGHYAAKNIHQKMMRKVFGTTPEFVELAEVEPGMGLALGKSAVGYFPSMGLSSGEETRELFFQGDLGFMICWKWMQLGTPMPKAIGTGPESETEAQTAQL